MSVLHRSSGDRGFVLITAIWLLLLGGTIVAILSLRAVMLSQATSAEAKTLMQHEAVRSATAVVLAGLKIDRSNSAWAHLPFSANIATPDGAVVVSATDEGELLDLNVADLTAIWHASSATFGTAGTPALVDLLTRRRAAKRLLRSDADMRLLFAEVESDPGVDGAGTCPPRFTVFTGRFSDLPSSALSGNASLVETGASAASIQGNAGTASTIRLRATVASGTEDLVLTGEVAGSHIRQANVNASRRC